MLKELLSLVRDQQAHKSLSLKKTPQKFLEIYEELECLLLKFSTSPAVRVFVCSVMNFTFATNNSTAFTVSFYTFKTHWNSQITTKSAKSVISEGSCDTEDCSNTALQSRKKLHLTYNGSKLNDCCLFNVPVKLQESCIILHSTKSTQVPRNTPQIIYTI